MWTVFKFEKKEFHLLKEDLKKKIGPDYIIYRPKVAIHKYKNNKLVHKEVDILGDYLFCYHKNFEKKGLFARAGGDFWQKSENFWKSIKTPKIHHMSNF